MDRPFHAAKVVGQLGITNERLLRNNIRAVQRRLKIVHKAVGKVDGLLRGDVVLDVIPREQLRTMGIKIVLLLGIFSVVTLAVTVLLRSDEGSGKSS
jgi:hypothetical protein